MALIFTVLEIVAPVFLLAAAGFLWVKLGFEYRVAFVTRLAMTLGVPCLIFTALMKTEIDSGAISALLLATVVAYALMTIVAYIVVRFAGISSRTFVAPLTFGNTGNLGLPLALFAFGDTGLSFALVMFAMMAIYSFTFGVWLVSDAGSPMNVIKEPIVWGSFFGGLFLWQGWQTPTFVTNTLELIGQMAIPLMLITLGVTLARLTHKSLGLPLVLAVVKFLFCLAIGWGVGRWFDLSPVAFGVFVLQITTPVAVTSYLLAEKYGADSDAVAGLVVMSTLLSVGTLPLTLAFVI